MLGGRVFGACPAFGSVPWNLFSDKETGQSYFPAKRSIALSAVQRSLKVLFTAVLSGSLVLSGAGVASAEVSPDIGYASALDVWVEAPGEVSELSEALDALPDAEPVVVGELEDDGSFVPTDSDSVVQLPTAGSGEQVGFELPIEGATVSTTEGGSAVFADKETGVEVSVQGVNTEELEGIESAMRALITIPDAQAPLEYEFPLDLPEGARASVQDEGGVLIENQDGELISAVGTPWAVDAEGKKLDTHFSIRDGVLVQRVEHENAVYPVVADPIWFVPIVVGVGVRGLVNVAVRAGTAQAAKQAAIQAAKKAGHTTAKKVAGEATKAAMKSKTFGNSRHNLSARTGKSPKNCQAHHVMPTKFAKDFGKAGINNNDPVYLVWWNSTKGKTNNHGSKAKAYNAEWQKFFDSFPRSKSPTRQQVLKQFTKMDNKYRKFYQC